MQIRDAEPDDWPAIYPFFAAIVADGRTYAYPPELPSESARELWTAPGRTTVAVEDDRVVGSATMGPNRPGRGDHVATASFMVDPHARARGAGRALGAEMIGWARDAGYRAIQFNAVVETNTVAVHLWHSLGFRTVGTVPGAFRHPTEGFVGLHVMHLDLTDGS